MIYALFFGIKMNRNWPLILARRTTGRSLRLAEMGNELSMIPHRDCTVLSLIAQHQVEGLELQLADGSWIAVPADDPDTFAVVADDLIQVVTNGRVPANLHRVRTPSDRERYSVQFESRPKCGSTVHPVPDLVGDGHPLRYNPCNFDEYINFLFMEGVLKLSDPLKSFCGAVEA